METIYPNGVRFSCKQLKYQFNSDRGMIGKCVRSNQPLRDLRTDDTLTSKGIHSHPISPKIKTKISKTRLSRFSNGKKNANQSAKLLSKRNFEDFNSDNIDMDIGSNEQSDRLNRSMNQSNLRTNSTEEGRSESSIIKSVKTEPNFDDFQRFYTKWALGQRLEPEDLKLNKKTEYLLRKIIETQGYYLCHQKNFRNIEFYRNLQRRTFKKSKEEKCKYAIKLSHKYLKTDYKGYFRPFTRNVLDEKMFEKIEDKDLFYFYYFYEHWNKIKTDKNNIKKKTILDEFFQESIRKSNNENLFSGNLIKKKKVQSKFPFFDSIRD